MAKTLHYDFLTNPTLIGSEHPVATSPTLSITRATKATMVDADGYIREVQSGEARFTGATWEQNLYKNSDDLSQATWNRVPTQYDYVDDPSDGSLSITFNNTGTSVGLGQNIAVNLSGGQTFTVQFEAKQSAGTLNSMELFRVFDGTAFVGEYSDTLTADWATYSKTFTVSSAVITLLQTQFFRASIVSGDTVHLRNIQLNIGSTPHTFISTGANPASSLTGTSTKGLLVEEARTNICLQSEDFSTTWALNANSAVNTNQTTAPDGSTTADRLVDDSGGGTGATLFSQNVTVSTSTAYTYSVFAKKDGLDWISLDVTNFTTPANSSNYFDLTNGVKGTIDAAMDDSGIESYGNGWYRCWVTFTTDSTDTFGTIGIRVAEADGDVVVDLDGTSSIFCWGAQLEAGAFPTSYIATTTASVTRNADDVTGTLTGQVGQVTGTFYAKAVKENLVNDFAYIMQIDDGSNTDRFLFYQANSMDPKFVTAESAGGQEASIDGTNLSNGVVTQIAIGATTDDVAYYQDGSLNGTDSTYDGLADALTTIRVGRSINASTEFNGHIAEIRHYNTRLTNAQLEDMSNGVFPSFDRGLTRQLTRGLTRDLTRLLAG